MVCGVVDGVLQIDALAAEHNRADGDALDFLVQVGNDKVGLVGADSAGFVVARQELDGVFAGQEREAGVVFDGALGKLERGGIGQLDVDVVAHVADRGAADQVLDFADEIDARVLGAAALGQGQLAAGNLHDDGNEILGAVELEVIDLHGDGEIGDGIVEHERVFKLALAVHVVELVEFLVRVIALAVVELGLLILLEGNA